MSKKSDEFEKQIYRIYKVLEADKNSVVTWNDKIKDPDNLKQKRQIDITIKKENVFTIVECRIHNKPQDVKWIEELIGRKLSLEADKVIAVSASGFTFGAIKKAEKFGVFLRDVNSITDDEVKLWASKSKISLGLFKYEDVEFYFVVKRKTVLPDIGEIVMKHIQDNYLIDHSFNIIKKTLQEDKFSSTNFPFLGEVLLSNKLSTINKDIFIKKVYFNSKISFLSKEYEVDSVIQFNNIKTPEIKENILSVEKFDIGVNEIIKKGKNVTPIMDFSSFEFDANHQHNGRIVNRFGDNFLIENVFFINGNSLNRMVYDEDNKIIMDFYS